MWNQKPYVDSQIRNFDYIAEHLTPDAEAADSGKVLTVGSDGKPEWANASGGASGLLVTATVGEDATTLDKTWNQIVDAINRGIIPFYLYEEEGAMVMSSVVAYGEGSTGDEPWCIWTGNDLEWQADTPDGTLTLNV